MTAALSTRRRSQSSAYAETISRSGRRPTARFIDFDLERSSEARRRRRIIVSAQHLAAFFEYRSDRGQVTHEGSAIRL